MLDDVRKYIDAALDKLSPARAQELARSLAKGEGRDQVARRAQELMDWSQRSRQRLTETVRREVTNQLKTLGVVTKDEHEALKKRLRELERAVGTGPGAKRRGSTAKRRTAKRSSSSKESRAES